ncbi:MAG: hypothetical protein RSD62_07645 [Ruthenibacterium sp.]
MLLSVVLTGLALYFFISALLFLSGVPFANWQLMHWVIAVLGLVLAFFAFTNGRSAWRLWKQKSVAIKQAMQAEEEKAHAKRRAFYLDDAMPDYDAFMGEEGEFPAKDAAETISAPAASPAADDTKSGDAEK